MAKESEKNRFYDISSFCASHAYDEVIVREKTHQATGTLELSEEFLSLCKKIVWLKEHGFSDGIRYQTSLYHDEPKCIRFVVKSLKASDSIIGAHGVGKSFWSETRALGGAYGELIERISLFSFHPKEALLASAADIGDSAVSLDNFCGVDNAKRVEIQASPAFRRNHPKAQLVFGGNSKFRWVEGQSLLSEEKKHIPLQLVSLAHTPSMSGEPVIRFPLSTGAAAGQTLDEAILAGILEVIERDAYMITWLNQLSPDVLDSASSDKITEIFDYFKRYDLELHMVCLPTDFEVPSFLAVVIDRTGIGPAITVGTKAGFDIEDIVEGIATDIVDLRLAMRKKIAEGYVFDPSHITLKNRAFFWWPLERIEDISFLLRGKRRSVDYFKKEYYSASIQEKTIERLEFLKRRLELLKLDAYYVNITPKEFKELDTSAVMVVIPQMQPMHVDECLPYIHGVRLRTVPEKFGFISKKDALNYPHPFA